LEKFFRRFSHENLESTVSCVWYGAVIGFTIPGYVITGIPAISILGMSEEAEFFLKNAQKKDKNQQAVSLLPELQEKLKEK